MIDSSKILHSTDTAIWFGNSDWGLGLSLPYGMAFLATAMEISGGRYVSTDY
jgi:putative oxidoreductase